MSDEEREELLGECLEEYHRRRALGERPETEEWEDWLGEHFEEFKELIAAASAIDDLIEPVPASDALPRAFGEYTLLHLLGRGAMGIVYEAVHRKLGRKVALKVLRTGFEDDPLAYERFRREAQACAQIRHDHVVTIYEVGQEEGRPFYAMPVLQGKSLLELIREDAAPPPEELCRGLADIADALHVLHEGGVIHRDVKPANIMVEPGGRMVLADFGLARSAASQTLTATGQALGTPLYMSPEQLLGQKNTVDLSSDVYGLGVTLYEALSGQPPFKADNLSGLMRMILIERPRPLTDVAREVPSGCANIAMKAIEKRKEDRYPSAAAMRDDLRAFAEGRKVGGRPVSNLRFNLRRHRWRLVAAAALVVVCTFLARWYFTREATLAVASFPVAEVVLDGESRGTTPLRVKVAPGEHELRLRQAGFGERTQRIRLSAGENRTLQTALIAADPEDPEALRRLGTELDVALEEFAAAARVRGAPPEGPPVQVLYPRGDVRLRDLTTWRVDVPDESYEIDGEVRFCRGDEVLARVPFTADLEWTIEQIPAALRDGLREGDTVTWGYYPRSGDPVTASFRVVPDELGPRIAALEKRLEGQPWIVASHLRTQLYLDRKLYTAALAESARIVGERKDSARGWAAMRVAVEGMGLGGSSLWYEVNGRILRQPRE